MKTSRKLALFVLALGLCGCAESGTGYHHDPVLEDDVPDGVAVRHILKNHDTGERLLYTRTTARCFQGPEVIE